MSSSDKHLKQKGKKITIKVKKRSSKSLTPVVKDDELWECIYCTKFKGTYDVVAEHEEICPKNPKNKRKITIKVKKTSPILQEPFEPIESPILEEQQQHEDISPKNIKKKTTIKVKRAPKLLRPTREEFVQSLSPIEELGRLQCSSGNDGSVVFTFPKGKPLLAEVYKEGSFDPTGWWASEKFDGYRAIWNGKEFMSRGGNVITVPDWFSALMPPDIALDGELWMGRGGFSSCGLFRHKVADSDEWVERQALFKVFDIPSVNEPFERRMEILEQLIEDRCNCMISLNLPDGIVDVRCPIQMTKQTLVKSSEHLSDMFDQVVANGGEGLMIRKPGSLYENKRSRTLYKLKPEYDTECKIIGYKEGTGKYTGMLGSFKCQLLDGNKTPFYVSGMTDEVRENYQSTHPVGTIITIIYTEMQKSGVPRHPRYLRIRADCEF